MGLKESGLRGSLRNVSVGIDAIPDTVVSRQDDNITSTQSGKMGLGIQTKSNWPSIAFRLSNNTGSDATRAYLHELDENDDLSTLISDVDISADSAGDIVEFNDVNLAANERFAIVIDAEESSFDVGFFDTDSEANYPYESEDVDIVGRIFDSGTLQSDNNNDPVAVNDIGNPDGVL